MGNGTRFRQLFSIRRMERVQYEGFVTCNYQRNSFGVEKQTKILALSLLY